MWPVVTLKASLVRGDARDWQFVLINACSGDLREASRMRFFQCWELVLNYVLAWKERPH